MRWKLISFLLLITPNVHAAAPQGIPRELARQRAEQLSEVRYDLEFQLALGASTVAGHEELRFRAKTSVAVLIDFREGAESKLVINGAPADAKMENGHIELPANAVRAGENTVSIEFSVPAATAGKAITQFEDRDDGSEYVYTLFVPMDAEMAFPCFDQPDLKGRFHLTLRIPAEWTAISNTAPESDILESISGAQQRQMVFAETRPVSTYLFAFAAGPFRKVHEEPGLPGLYVRKSKVKRAEEEAPDVQKMTAQGIQYLSDFFAQPFPFPKYDLVLIPGFAFGGMEHAGATFLREESVLFRAAPTHSDYLERDIVLLHELAHQWFGDLVTMRWFDDLWLKEGFAQYMAYEAQASIKPSENVWKRFYQAIKPAAYEIDATKGTTAIYQNIANLKDAKSAYGAIVYRKAPGVLKQLAFVAGEDNFREGLRLYLKEHAYGNAELSDLVGALERVSGRRLQDWAPSWIRRRGMPEVQVQWSCDAENRIDHFSLEQRDVLGEGGVWRIAMQVLLSYPGGAAARIHAELNGQETELREAIGKPCPRYVFANDQDYAYGRFLLDSRSRGAVMEELGGVTDVFERALLWGSLWDAVREAELAPREFLETGVKFVPAEKDEELAQSVMGHVTTALQRYANASVHRELLPKVEAVTEEWMMHAPEQDFRILGFRGLRGVAESEEARRKLRELLDGKLKVPGVELRPLDRWTIVTALIAVSDPQAEAVLAAEQKRDASGDGKKYAYMAQAARPDSKTKRQYFDDYLHNASREEDWIAQSLRAFNYWNQSELTLPYLKPALEALPQIKRERKIFFLLGWLEAFLGGQQSAAAQQQVREFLGRNDLDADLRLKILETSDELDRTVKIRN
jgi:aminopeptidase N